MGLHVGAACVPHPGCFYLAITYTPTGWRLGWSCALRLKKTVKHGNTDKAHTVKGASANSLRKIVTAVARASIKRLQQFTGLRILLLVRAKRDKGGS